MFSLFIYRESLSASGCGSDLGVSLVSSLSANWSP